MTTAAQKEMIVALLREGETFSSAAEIMNKNHLASGQNPFTRSAIAGVAHRAGFRKNDHGITTVRRPATRTPATPKPQTAKDPAKPKSVQLKTVASTIKPAAVASGKTSVRNAKKEPETLLAKARGTGPKNIEDLGSCDCRWPSKSEPSSDRTSHFYCETPAMEGKPYCAYHLHLAHFKSSEKTAA